jgi:hypothetical protein
LCHLDCLPFLWLWVWDPVDDGGGDEEEDRGERDCGEGGSRSHCAIRVAQVAGWGFEDFGRQWGKGEVSEFVVKLGDVSYMWVFIARTRCGWAKRRSRSLPIFSYPKDTFGIDFVK